MAQITIYIYGPLQLGPTTSGKLEHTSLLMSKVILRQLILLRVKGHNKVTIQTRDRVKIQTQPGICAFKVSKT